jgi:hypothetical protein
VRPTVDMGCLYVLSSLYPCMCWDWCNNLPIVTMKTNGYSSVTICNPNNRYIYTIWQQKCLTILFTILLLIRIICMLCCILHVHVVCFCTINLNCIFYFEFTWRITHWDSTELPSCLWFHGVTPGGARLPIRIPAVISCVTYCGVR